MGILTLLQQFNISGGMESRRCSRRASTWASKIARVVLVGLDHHSRLPVNFDTPRAGGTSHRIGLAGAVGVHDESVSG